MTSANVLAKTNEATGWETEPKSAAERSAKGKRWIAGIVAGASAVTAMTFLFTKIAIWISGGILTLFCSTMARGQQASIAVAQASRPEATVLQAAETYRQAVLKGDPATVVSQFREDGVEMPPNQHPVEGKSAITQFYQGMFHSPVKIASFIFSHTETSVHGDVALDVGTYKRRMSTPGGPVEVAGPYVVILKQTEGSWKIAYLIYNCDCPPGT